MEPNNITDPSLSGAAHVDAAGGSAAVGGQNPQEQTLTLSELKAILGKDFKDKDTAIKSVKDTFSYVGKVGQLEKELVEARKVSQGVANTQNQDELRADVQKMKDELWFADNAQYKPHRQLVETFAKAQGKSLHEAVELPVFKDVFSKVQGFEQSQSLRTVLESNPRLASSQTKITKAQELASTNSRRNHTEAKEMAVNAVLEAFPEFDPQK